MSGDKLTISDMLIPALVGGGIAGLLSGMPVVGCLCCLWLLGGGFLAIYMLRGRSFGMGEALLVGIIAGFFAAIAGSVAEAFMNIVSGQGFAGAMAQAIEAMRQSGAPPQTIRQMEQIARMMSGGLGAIFMVCLFFFRFLFYAIFTSVGALVGKAVMK